MSDASEHKTLPPGSVFGRYTITRLIGAGGMGAVYEAQHNDLKKRVAIKTLHQAFADHGEIQARFMREGESASRIRHPHVVDVTDFGVQDGVPFLVMEYLEGESLGELLEREHSMSPERVADVLLPVCAGIAAAHDEGVIHRDLKPDNLFLARSRKGGDITPKVVDFGISKVDDGQQPSSLTSTGSMLGTPFYMSPEQLRTAKNIDHRIDQYALGVIMYECVTGERPFMAETLYEMMHKIATGDFLPPRSINSAIPEEFERIVLRAMNRTPEERYPSVRALAAALLSFASPKVRARWDEEFSGSADMLEVVASRGAVMREARDHNPKSSPNHAFLSASQLFEDQAPPPSPVGGSMAMPVGALGGTQTSGAQTGVMQSMGASTMANTGREIDMPFAAPPPPPPKSPSVYIAVAVLVLGLVGAGIFVGMRSGGTGASAHPATGAATAVATYTAELATVPPTATIELDGQNVGAGAYAHAFTRDGTTHTVRVSAPGYVPRAFTFRDAPPDRVVQLEAVPSAVATAVPSGVMMMGPNGVVMVPTASPTAVAQPQPGGHHAGGPRVRPTAAPTAAAGNTGSTGNTGHSNVGTGANGAAILQ